MKGLGAHIRDLRERRDISLRELARQLECSAAFLSDIELGKRHPGEETLLELAKHLGTTSDELLKHDVRAPLDEIKRITESNPKYALAFRTMIDKNISADRLMEMMNKEHKKPGGK
jgi:transcriptional regulator with XRE-family HTH domain